MTVIARLALVLLAQLLFLQAASAKDDFLPPDQAYRYTARVEGDRVIVAWNIEPGYYLYKKKMGVVSAATTVQVGEPLWPKGCDWASALELRAQTRAFVLAASGEPDLAPPDAG